MARPTSTLHGWGLPWLALTLALALHVWDEAANDFLSLYNPAVVALRERSPSLPLPTFTYEGWLSSLAVVVAVLLLLSVFAFRGSRVLRPVAYGFAGLMLLNGLLHLTISAVDGEMMAGAYSAPALIAAAAWLWVRLRREPAATAPPKGA